MYAVLGIVRQKQQGMERGREGGNRALKRRLIVFQEKIVIQIEIAGVRREDKKRRLE